jgi:Protein of unknown function (DUF1064)
MYRSKYKAVKAVYNGITFDSKVEASYCRYLDGLKIEGKILYYVRQPRFVLGPLKDVCRLDFHVVEEHCSYIDEVKGVEPPKFKRDRKLWAAYGELPLRIIKPSCKYLPDELPIIRKIKCEIVRGGLDKRPDSIHHPSWLRSVS